jgi:hypothetical protein
VERVTARQNGAEHRDAAEHGGEEQMNGRLTLGPDP